MTALRFPYTIPCKVAVFRRTFGRRGTRLASTLSLLQLRLFLLWRGLRSTAFPRTRRQILRWWHWRSNRLGCMRFCVWRTLRLRLCLRRRRWRWRWYGLFRLAAKCQGRHQERRRGNLADEPIALLVDANKVRSTLTNSSGDYTFVVTSVKIAVSVIMTSVLDLLHFKTTNDFIYSLRILRVVFGLRHFWSADTRTSPDSPKQVGSSY